MNMGMEDNKYRETSQAYARAEKLVAEKIGFIRHLIIYVLVNVLLLVINLVTSSDFFWFLFPLGGWGILLLAHFLSVFIFRGERFERWRRSEIEREMTKLRREE
jgi:hypothetical protein